MASPTLAELISAFLDDVAEFFDNGTSISPDSLFTDPRDGEPITARGLLELIRLGKTDKPVNPRAHTLTPEEQKALQNGLKKEHGDE